MPKGVEHRDDLRGGGIPVFVEEPLMPKGVEHGKSPPLAVSMVTVEEPLMPKGVEHPENCWKRQASSPWKNL